MLDFLKNYGEIDILDFLTYYLLLSLGLVSVYLKLLTLNYSTKRYFSKEFMTQVKGELFIHANLGSVPPSLFMVAKT